MQEYEYHPLANIFPLLEGVEFDEMCDSVEAIGLTNPIVLYEGKILDGRNRYRACLDRGIRPEFVPFGGTNEDAAEYVAAGNIFRRNLTPSQRAMAMADLTQNWGLSLRKAAQVSNVPLKSLHRATQVAGSNDTNVVQMVRSGEMGLTKAHDVVTGKVTLDEATKRGRKPGNANVQKLKKAIATLLEIPDDKEQEIAKHWDGTTTDLHKVKRRVSAYLTAIQGANLADTGT